MTTAISALFAALVLDAPVLSGAMPEHSILATEQAQARWVIINGAADSSAPFLWTWSAADDPGVAAADRKAFTAPSECKVRDNGGTLLIGASGGGFAAIDVATRRAEFYGHVPGNLHSIERLPDGRIALACSTGATVWLADVSAAPLEPARQKLKKAFALPAAHGLVWDAPRRVLWALGETNLVKLAYVPETFELRELRRYDFRGGDTRPECGHDLIPDGKNLVLTGHYRVLRFNPDTETFTEVFPIVNVKSVSFSAAGEPLFAIPNESWWTDRLQAGTGKTARVIGPFKGARFYKARWMGQRP
jgi:hypothetical protein